MELNRECILQDGMPKEEIALVLLLAVPLCSFLSD